MKLSLTNDPFEDFWRAYPRRVGKGAAQKAFDKVVNKMKISSEVIIDGAKRYAAAKAGSEIQYIAHAGTWLNQQRWLDEDHNSTDLDAGPHKVDSAALDWLSRNKLAREIKERLIRQTRETHADRIREAARRLNCTEPELWSCLRHGYDGIENRAWDAAVADAFNAERAPGALTIEKSHWISAKDRHETRTGIVRQSRNSLFTAPESSDNYEPVHSKREMDDDDYSAASTGMA